MGSTASVCSVSGEHIAGIKLSDLPAPPRQAIRVVQACSNTEITSSQLADLVATDPVMTAEILRIANSPLFGFSTEVKSVARAVTVVGHRALRNVILCIAMRDALRADAIPGFDIDAFWEDALFRAVAARSLADVAGLDKDECFTTGLLQDFGLLVMLFVMPQQAIHWADLSDATPDDRRQLELSLFNTTHDHIGITLARNWELPVDLAIAMGFHHTAPPDDIREDDVKLCRVAECADWIAAIFCAREKRACMQHTREMLKTHFALEPEQIDPLLDEIPAAVEEAAVAMGLRLEETVSFDEVMRDANLRLAEENISYQELNWQLEQALDARDQVSRELHRELELAREVQRSLLPQSTQHVTGITGINLSAREVSGDFYDIMQLRDGRVLFCIADVSGKGMNAALLMAKASSLFHCLGKGIHDPAKLLGMLNKEIFETSIRGMFVTMIAGVYDPAQATVVLSNAGHLPAVVMNPYELLSEHGATAPPLGINPYAEFSNETFRLGAASLYLYTDGLLEARTGSGERLERAGLLRLLKEHADTPLDQRLPQIAGSVSTPGGNTEDDLTLLLIDGRSQA